MDCDAKRRPSVPVRPLLLGLGLVLVAWAGPARAEPPIQSPVDAFCREEAKARVYSVPDPLNLGLREIGRKIHAGCMQRMTKRTGGKRKKLRRRR